MNAYKRMSSGQLKKMLWMKREMIKQLDQEIAEIEKIIAQKGNQSSDISIIPRMERKGKT
ncbi:Uncharacterised protein [Mycobacterium tuberculosis]|nr:Uncharacterised protein [Mycobacterium tuberculosis]